MSNECSKCGKDADLAMNSVISTKGRSPRLQRCTKGVFFCMACLQALCMKAGGGLPPALRDALREALTRLQADCAQQSKPVCAASSGETVNKSGQMGVRL